MWLEDDEDEGEDEEEIPGHQRGAMTDVDSTPGRGHHRVATQSRTRARVQSPTETERVQDYLTRNWAIKQRTYGYIRAQPPFSDADIQRERNRIVTQRLRGRGTVDELDV